MKGKLNLGIPKGSLQNATLALFKRSGWTININGRSYFPEINDDSIKCAICRAQEISRYVENGTLDAGLTGKDWIAENNSDVQIVQDLVYSKVSARPARWVLAVPYDSPVQSLEDLKGKKIATELVEFTRRYFSARKIDVEIEFLTDQTGSRADQVLIVQEAVRRGGVASDIASIVQEEEFSALASPVRILAGKNTPIPYNLNLEKACVPQEEDIIAMIKEMKKDA